MQNKQHIGEMVCEFDMFNYLPIKFRLIIKFREIVTERF